MRKHIHTSKVSALLKQLHKTNSNFLVCFIKKDGTKRVMWAQYGVQNNLKGGINHTQQSHFPYSTVWDVNKKQYRTINMSTVLCIAIARYTNHDEYIINHDKLITA